MSPPRRRDARRPAGGAKGPPHPGLRTLGLVLPGLGHLATRRWLDGLGMAALAVLLLGAGTRWRALLGRLDAPGDTAAWVAAAGWWAAVLLLWGRAVRDCLGPRRRPPIALPRADAWERLARALRADPGARAGLYVVLLVTLVALLAPMLATWDPNDVTAGPLLAPPSAAHWFGTDANRRDVWSRVVHGAPISLAVSLSAVALATALGAVVGALAGLVGGLADRLLTALMDLGQSIPRLVLLLAAAGSLRHAGAIDLVAVVLILALTGWVGTARLVRARAMALREAPFVLAARALGAGTGRILLRHVLPATSGTILSHGLLSVGGTLLTLAALGFLGLGVPPPSPTWGGMVAEGTAWMRTAWWLPVFPGLFIAGTATGFNLLAEGVRAALDPRLGEPP